ncbi:MAG TPA: hypothetical protein VIC33_03225 [Vicinamibacterales bacterium]|jgi:hypothetical protein
MKQFVLGLAILCLGVAVPVQAQTASSTDRKIFVEGDGGVTFGGTTSSMGEAQVGYRFSPTIDLFAEVGRMQNVASNAIALRAGVITNYLNTQGIGVASASVNVPATFGAVGVRYRLPKYFVFQPYALGAVGAASVKNNVKFSLDGTDISGQMLNYGVQLGSDLSGTQTAALLSLGGGVLFPWHSLYFDGSIRYDRLFTTGSGTNVGFFYVGAGYAF